MINIVCVLKSGGDFDERYVYNLLNGIVQHVNIPYNFYCFSDLTIPKIDIIPLKYDLKGWWSKLEIFAMEGPVLYIDLDTIILNDIDGLVKDILTLESAYIPPFLMLDAFNPYRQFASGIMAWDGDYSWLVEECMEISANFIMDQDCIYAALDGKDNSVQLIDRNRYNIKSYKHNNINGELPDCNILCFHGKPRPHEVIKDW